MSSVLKILLMRAPLSSRLVAAGLLIALAVTLAAGVAHASGAETTIIRFPCGNVDICRLMN